MKFLHTADWHLGRVFSRFDRRQNEALSEARFKTVRSIMEYADAQGIGLVLCCGDQFENGEFKSPELIGRLFSIIGLYPHIRVVMIAGNHDPLIANNIYDRTDPSLYPKNLYFVRGQETVRLGKEALGKEVECIIYAASLSSKNGRSNPLGWIIEDQKKRRDADSDQDAGSEQVVGLENGPIKIGMGHGSLAIEGKYQPDDFPIEPDFARAAGLDYLALGHWHSFSGTGPQTDDSAIGNTTSATENSFVGDTFYPGTPEAMTFEQDCSVLEVEITAPGEKPHIKKAGVKPRFEWRREKVLLNDDNLENIGAGDDGDAGGGGGSSEKTGPISPILEGGTDLKGCTDRTILHLSLEGALSPHNYELVRQRVSIVSHELFALFLDNNTRIAANVSELTDISSLGYLRNVIEKCGEGESIQTYNGILPEPERITSEEVQTAALAKIHDYLRSKELL